jgi:hypothetical protein
LISEDANIDEHGIAYQEEVGIEGLLAISVEI